jgi:ABC-type phosphate transport system ATPase subunit
VKIMLCLCEGGIWGVIIRVQSDVVFSPTGLSGGERKRLNIATELIFDPSILFLVSPPSFPCDRGLWGCSNMEKVHARLLRVP